MLIVTLSERMRQRLLDFVGHMRQALAILATTHV
jgi:hypothetical protein